MNNRFFSIYILVLILISHSALAAQTMSVDIKISKNDIVSQNIDFNFASNNTYNTVEFKTLTEPLSILYEGDYTINRIDDEYVIEFDKQVGVGENQLRFSLLYDNLVDKSFNDRVFKTSFYSENTDQVLMSLTLPQHFVLSDKVPNTMPKPDSITTDGQYNTLVWEFEDPESVDIAVFYRGGQENYNLLIAGFLVLIVAAVIIFFVFHKKSLKKYIADTLTSEELKIIEEVRKGTTKQKDVAKNLDFSKSKMSKVVRKLEEKEILKKKPYFKTNILVLSKRMK